MKTPQTLKYFTKGSYPKFLTITIGILSISACSEFIEIAPPRTDLVRTTVFADAPSAEAATVELYNSLTSSNFTRGTALSFSFAGGAAADELINNYNGYLKEDFQQLSSNEITPANEVNESYWSNFYTNIYNANSILDGLLKATNIADTLRSRLQGEALFMRAFSYFYLVNLYGKVPLILTTDYVTNRSAVRSEKSEVYKQIITDLVSAKGKLPEDYSPYNQKRVRSNKFTASALLARVYLYTEDWNNAEIESSILIENPLYSLETDLQNVFKSTSKEVILQLWTENLYTQESLVTLLSYFPLHEQLIERFEESDKRFVAWTSNNGENTFAAKYKFIIPSEDYSTVLRLAEQYLIRAEARTKQGKVSEASSDINSIRERAGLSIQAFESEDKLMSAIADERQKELFTEWGHRWFDLKRTNKIDQVMTTLKGSIWQQTDALYPIPAVQLLNDPEMADDQNMGY